MRPYLALFLLIYSVAGNSVQSMHAGGGDLVLELNTGLLEPMGIEVQPVDAMEIEPPPARGGYMRIRLAGRDDERLDVDVPARAIEGFSAGRLAYHGGVRLQIENRMIDLTEFTLVPRDDDPFEFNLVDAAGTAWFRLDHTHYEIVEGPILELRHMNLTALEPLEAAIGVPGITGQVLGVAHVRARLTGPSLQRMSNGRCEAPSWATDPEFVNQITLTDISGASAMRCTECNGVNGGPVVFAPDARLKNEGTAEVPWWHQFIDGNPPYGNDQHPFLIWNLYRVDAEQRLEQIGASGLKHAFFAANGNCECPESGILWTGCTDIYGRGNNDSAVYLGPRNELIPVTGRWGRCHSFFDPDCSGTQTQHSGLNSHVNRMNVMERDIAPENNPGVRYIMEAWYVVRENEDIFRAMGWREFKTAWNGQIWSTRLTGDFTQGAFIDTWVDPEAPAPGQMNTPVITPSGQLKVAVRTVDLGNGIWRYDYAVANFDYMNTLTRGSEPNLQIIENIGIIGVRVPVANDIVVNTMEFARADRTTGEDWPAVRRRDAVEWQTPGDSPLDWGLLYRFSVEASAAPARVLMELRFPARFANQAEAPSGNETALVVETLGPGATP